MIQESKHYKKLAADFNFVKILAVPEDDQVEADTMTGRTKRKMKRVNQRGSDESGNEKADELDSGTYEMKIFSVKRTQEIDSNYTQTKQSQISL